MMERCRWVPAGNEMYIAYHDDDWGVPVHDDRLLFEMLILEGAQAGLSWETILKKRLNYRTAFKNFDPVKVARFADKDIQKLLANEGIVRNRLKISAAIDNAKVFLALQKEFGSFDSYIWKYVDNVPINPAYTLADSIPTSDAISDAISKDLKKRGMRFVGTTIIYAYMQAIGMINAHTVNCFRHKDL